MQLVLDDQVRRQQAVNGQGLPLQRMARPVEAVLSYRCTRPKNWPTSPVHGIAANLSTVAIMKQGSRR